jgi:phage gpG-like protein
LDNQRVNRISRHSARFGTGIPYAKFHQEGTSRMPKRQLVFIPEKFEHDISDKISDYINNGRI